MSSGISATSTQYLYERGIVNKTSSALAFHLHLSNAQWSVNQVTGHWSLVTGHWSLDSGHLLLIGCYWLLVIGHLQ